MIKEVVSVQIITADQNVRERVSKYLRLICNWSGASFKLLCREKVVKEVFGVIDIASPRCTWVFNAALRYLSNLTCGFYAKHGIC